MQLSSAKRMVIKIGSALLVEPSSGAIHQAWLETLIEDIARCHQRGQEIVIVTSGAIAVGKKVLNLAQDALPLDMSQAAAAVGQVRLAHRYQTLLDQHGITAAQVLLTMSDSEHRQRYLNAHNTLRSLLACRAVPIINENDTVATAEIRYGDNDRLAARVAQMIGADVLVLLSDIDGLYEADPNREPNAKHVPTVSSMTDHILAMASDAVSHVGSGGMRTKLYAAKMVMDSGCHMVITNGYQQHPLSRLEQGATCTWFTPSTTPSRARKQWLAHHLQTQGQLHIDAGAQQALLGGKSLLAAGVVSVHGAFAKGDAVSVWFHDQEIARGLVNYPARDLQQILGQHSDSIAKILGYQGANTVIHRDDLAIVAQGKQYE